MAFWSITFEGTEAETCHVEEALEETALSCSRFEKKGTQGKKWIFEALFERDPLAQKETLPWDALKAYDLERFQSHRLPEKDWIAENRMSFPPLSVGRFLIYSSHAKPPSFSDRVLIEINASLAFGTGGHATTQGCLELLETLEGAPLRSILDLGCGTGLLAIAARHLFPKAARVVASDHDQEAVDMTRYNLTLNGLDGKIEPVLSEGFAAPFFQEGSYDLILANILAGPLVELAPDMACQCTAGSYLILSGILHSQEEDILQAYLPLGFELQACRRHEEWSALLLRAQSPF